MLSTSTLLRQAPVIDGKMIQILRCGDEVTFDQKKENENDYGRWFSVTLKKNKKVTGWLPKSVLQEREPLCPLKDLSTEQLSGDQVLQIKRAKTDEFIEGARFFK